MGENKIVFSFIRTNPCCTIFHSVTNMPTDRTTACAAAVGLAGIAAGALSFVSAVDVRAILGHVREKRHDTIRAHFALWWPAGRDFMVPLIASATLANVGAYAATKDGYWLVSAGAIGITGPYTGIVLGEDIKQLRGEPDDVQRSARRFCALHHVRTGLAIAAFGTSVLSFARHCAQKS